MEIYQSLKKDHDRVKELFQQAKQKKTGSKGSDNIFPEIRKALEMHTEIEENLFYSVLKEEETLREDILEAYEEHHIVTNVLREMSKLSPQDERWMAKLTVLQELVEHHIEEEEEGIFKKAKKVLDKKQAEDIGSKFEQQKEKRAA
jgi:hemerythrin superfamily protein